MRLSFSRAPKPFVRESKHPEHGSIAMSVDWANFESRGSHATFLKTVKGIDQEIVPGVVGRRSLVPEPFIQFFVSNIDLGIALSVGLWTIGRVEKFIRYTVDETLKKTADGISDSLSSKIGQIVKAYNNRESDDDRPVLTKVVLQSDVHVVLITKTERDEEFPEVMLRGVVKEMERYGDLLKHAEEVTLSRVGTDEWKLQYLTTRNGQVIGTSECYGRTMERLRRIQESQNSIARHKTVFTDSKAEEDGSFSD